MFIVSASHKDDSSFSHFLVGCKKKKKKKKSFIWNADWNSVSA